MKKYQDMSKNEKLELFANDYEKKLKSFRELAELTETYPNRLRRDAQKLGFKIRDRSSAQSVALKTGRVKHPTEGKQRSESTKIKISEKKAESWKNMPKEQRKKISDGAKKQWDEMEHAKKVAFREKASNAVRKAAKHGSKLEKHIFEELIKSGYRVDFHKEHTLLNEKLQVDLFLPTIGIAIEVDGPSHHKPIWGTKTLARNKKADAQKNGSLLHNGFVVIRIKQDAPLSAKLKRDVTNKLIEVIEKIKKEKPEFGKRYIEI
jgi:very-short-patch-repair endonuclease